MISGAAALVVMGVAGAGKTHLARAVCEATGAAFIEGDDLHPAANVAKMAAGIPLDDEDRAVWLASVGRQLAARHADGHLAIATCSALKRRYRDRLRADVPWLSFVFLRLDEATAAVRVARRPGHFMPAQLVTSQFVALEPPMDEPGVLVLDATLAPGDLLAQTVTWWQARIAGTGASFPAR